MTLLTALFAGCINSSSLEDNTQKYAHIDSLLNVMTLEEKIGQMTLYTSGWDTTGPSLNENYLESLKAGKVGALFNAHTVAYNKELQRIAVEDTRLGIPLLFGYDVIHGHKTIFPVPLAEACSWDLELIKTTARLSAKEAAASGLNWTFNPMVDIARDPRWGRIAEGSGEDPYLGSLIGAARIEGYQGDDLKDPYSLLACVKHFAAYGAAQAGRDYHTVDMSDRVLRETFLPPYQAAINAGVGTVMTSFNEIDGVPASGNSYLLTDILRDEWGFDGFVVTDYTSINEMVAHGIVHDEKEAALLAFQAGVQMDMQGGLFEAHLGALVEEGKIQEVDINKAVKQILITKDKLGLIDDPYRYLDLQREKDVVLSEEMREHALAVAKHAIVLLKNEAFKQENKVLPITKQVKKIAIIGPLGNNKIDMLGSWHASGDVSSVVTLLEGIQQVFPLASVSFTEGVDEDGLIKNFAKTRKMALEADVVLLAIGENYRQSGEAASRAVLGLPGQQHQLVDQIMALNKPTVAVVIAGRPLTLTAIDRKVPAIINASQLGTMSGRAIAEVLAGDFNPSGKLVSTFPRSVGQIPIHYDMKNTGRPFNASNKYTSKYLDESNDPLYPFGYGLSYTNFEYSNIELSANQLSMHDQINATIYIKNTGPYDGHEIVQLYIKDKVGSVTRPVKALKGFQKVFLQKNETKAITFSISTEELAFFTRDMKFQAEPGEFEVQIGGNAKDVQHATFVLTE